MGRAQTIQLPISRERWTEVPEKSGYLGTWEMQRTQTPNSNENILQSVGTNKKYRKSKLEEVLFVIDWAESGTCVCVYFHGSTHRAENKATSCIEKTANETQGLAPTPSKGYGPKLPLADTPPSQRAITVKLCHVLAGMYVVECEMCASSLASWVEWKRAAREEQQLSSNVIWALDTAPKTPSMVGYRFTHRLLIRLANFRNDFFTHLQSRISSPCPLSDPSD